MVKKCILSYSQYLVFVFFLAAFHITWCVRRVSLSCSEWKKKQSLVLSVFSAFYYRVHESRCVSEKLAANCYEHCTMSHVQTSSIWKTKLESHYWTNASFRFSTYVACTPLLTTFHIILVFACAQDLYPVLSMAQTFTFLCSQYFFHCLYWPYSTSHTVCVHVGPRSPATHGQKYILLYSVYFSLFYYQAHASPCVSEKIVADTWRKQCTMSYRAIYNLLRDGCSRLLPAELLRWIETVWSYQFRKYKERETSSVWD